MKKVLFTLLCITLGATAQAQEYNLFYDVDENGWLWFDTQEKIDKYIGICDEEYYKVDPNGKPIQLIYADILPDYPATIADPYQEGAGTDGEIGTDGCRTGSIIVAGSSNNMEPKGGGFVVLMPSCSTFSICLSCEGSTYVRMMSSKDVNKTFTNYDVISALYATVFKPLFRGGVFTWTGIKNLDNGNEGAYNLKTNQPIYAYFQSLTRLPIYIHGIRVTTPTNSKLNVTDASQKSSTPIFVHGRTISLNQESDIEVYSTNSLLMRRARASQMDLNGLPKALYVVKVGKDTRKVAVY